MRKLIFPSNLIAASSAAFSILTASVASAAIVASYEFTGGALTSSDSDLTTTAENYTGTPVPGTASTGRLTYTAFDSPTTRVESTGYASFTLNPEASTISLASLTFDYGFQTGTTGGDYAMQVFSNLTGFTTSDSPLFSIAPFEGSMTPTGRFIDLSTYTEFQNITAPVEFRFYFTDAHVGATRYHLLDNVVLSTVPEPSSLLLGVIAGAAAIARRRRI